MVLLFTSSYCPLCTKEAEPGIRFEYLSPELKRVWLAKDVVTQITTKKLAAKYRSFIRFSVDKTGKEQPCAVCALGALVISCLPILANPNCNLKDIAQYRKEIHTLLNPYFSSEQLDLIESAFEQRIHTERYVSEKDDKSPLRDASMAYYNITDATERMLVIMQNIIDNNGTFVVPE